MIPRATYDPEARAIVIELEEGTAVAGTVQFPDDEHLIDVDECGRAVSIEILSPGRWMLSEIAERFGFAARADEVQAAIRQAMAPRTRGGRYIYAEPHVRAGVQPTRRARAVSGASGSSARELDLSLA